MYLHIQPQIQYWISTFYYSKASRDFLYQVTVTVARLCAPLLDRDRARLWNVIRLIKIVLGGLGTCPDCPLSYL